MIEVSLALAAALTSRGVPAFETVEGATSSHQLAIRAIAYGGIQAASSHLRKAGLLASGIGLPIGRGVVDWRVTFHRLHFMNAAE